MMVFVFSFLATAPALSSFAAAVVTVVVDAAAVEAGVEVATKAKKIFSLLKALQ